jgi:hypothetical protein|tara:strand:- start:116 stop:271 length:156 start_codon:yes stop_codon:yes gene_type:complete
MGSLECTEVAAEVDTVKELDMGEEDPKRVRMSNNNNNRIFSKKESPYCGVN